MKGSVWNRHMWQSFCSKYLYSVALIVSGYREKCTPSSKLCDFLPSDFPYDSNYSKHFHAISSMPCPLTVSAQMGKTPTLNLYSVCWLPRGRLTCVRSISVVARIRSGWNIQRLISSGLLSPARPYFSKVPQPGRTARPAGDLGPKWTPVGEYFTFKP